MRPSQICKQLPALKVYQCATSCYRILRVKFQRNPALGSRVLNLSNLPKFRNMPKFLKSVSKFVLHFASARGDVRALDENVTQIIFSTCLGIGKDNKLFPLAHAEWTPKLNTSISIACRSRRRGLYILDQNTKPNYIDGTNSICNESSCLCEYFNHKHGNVTFSLTSQ